MIPLSLLLPVAFTAAVAAQYNSIVCATGQCLQGVTNTTLGGTLSIPSNPSILLLPGQYTSSSQSQLLHDALSSQQGKLSLSSGFSNSSTSSNPSLPLTVALQPGVLSYSQSLYRGPPSFIAPTLNRTTTTLPPGSLLVASNTWAALLSSNNRIIVWDTIPDFAQLPLSSVDGVLSLLDVQSTTCSTPCASPGTCSPSGQCLCPPHFTGQSCESCASGFFGPSCQPCPSNCTTCDEGLTGSGKCLVPAVSNLPSSCNCLNGVCGRNGCTCNPGWTNNSNGTACASCAPGFYLDSNGNCAVCAPGCTQCADGTGNCSSCKSGLTPDSGQPHLCAPLANSGAGNSSQECGAHFFFGIGGCTKCSQACQSCTGPTDNDCILCNLGLYLLNGHCVTPDPNGVCPGTTMVANNLQTSCDSCPAKCTACKISNFNNGSSTSDIQCTGCLPGFVLSQGKCVAQCPSGTFLASDNLTCTPCDSSCSTCVGDAKFCRSCNSNQLAINGTCTASCPTNTFLSGGACLLCHPDCATCSGGAFNQCSTCSSSRPVLSSGRCFPTCSRSEFLDTTSSSCKSCDGSCASCTGAGSNACLACADPNQVVRSGACVASNCTSSSTIVPGLGVCLSDLVAVPNPTSPTPPPLPTLTLPVTSRGQGLAWWEVLLMVLGGAFILVLILWLWRRHARKQRAQQTAMFATKLKHETVWRRRFDKFTTFFTGNHQEPHPPSGDENEYERLQRLRDAETARHEKEMRNLEGGYIKSLRSSRSPQPSIGGADHKDSPSFHRASADSMYSQVTDKSPESKPPLREFDLELGGVSRFSTTTRGSSIYRSPSDRRPEAQPMPSDAEMYAAKHRQPTSFWLLPAQHTGGSRNPFRR